MISLFSIVALGFLLGMRHATDPDHVIAVTTIVARHRSTRQGAVIGAIWGIGHTLTILCVGSGILLLNWVIPPRLGLSMELSVGVMLIVLGVWNLSAIAPWFRQGPTGSFHSHPHAHGDYVHIHPHNDVSETHSHMPAGTPLDRLDRAFGRLGFYQILRPLIVGIVHGLAGSAAVALLVVATIQNVKWAILYLLVFGLGTVVGMILVTVAIAIPFAYTKGSSGWHRGLGFASGLISLGFGLFIVYQIGVADGLFSLLLSS
jgi:high-affinity nickel-transport protein